MGVFRTMTPNVQFLRRDVNFYTTDVCPCQLPSTNDPSTKFLVEDPRRRTFHSKFEVLNKGESWMLLHCGINTGTDQGFIKF